MENNIKLSHMSHWKTVPYKQIDNFRDFYYEDKSNNCYYMDWDVSYVTTKPQVMMELKSHHGILERFLDCLVLLRSIQPLRKTMELKSVVCSMAAMIHTLHPNMMK